jgi:hypothetical protein
VYPQVGLAISEVVVRRGLFFKTQTLRNRKQKRQKCTVFPSFFMGEKLKTPNNTKKTKKKTHKQLEKITIHQKQSRKSNKRRKKNNRHARLFKTCFRAIFDCCLAVFSVPPACFFFKYEF